MKWHERKGETPEKDKPMIMDSDNFHRIIAMYEELIMEQKAEISKLKHKSNILRDRLNSCMGKLNARQK